MGATRFSLEGERERVKLARSEWRSNKEKFVIAAVSFLRSSNWITSSESAVSDRQRERQRVWRRQRENILPPGSDSRCCNDWLLRLNTLNKAVSAGGREEEESDSFL